MRNQETKKGQKKTSNIVLVRSDPVCVCVCHTLFLRVLQRCPTLPASRGVWPSCPTTRNEAVGKKGKQGLIIPVHLLQLLNTLSNLIGLIHGPSCYLPLKPFSLSHFQQPRVLQLVTAVVRKPFVKTPSTHRTFHRAVPPPFFLEIELTENQCQSVFVCWTSESMRLHFNHTLSFLR